MKFYYISSHLPRRADFKTYFATFVFVPTLNSSTPPLQHSHTPSLHHSLTPALTSKYSALNSQNTETKRKHTKSTIKLQLPYKPARDYPHWFLRTQTVSAFSHSPTLSPTSKPSLRTTCRNPPEVLSPLKFGKQMLSVAFAAVRLGVLEILRIFFRTPNDKARIVQLRRHTAIAYCRLVYPFIANLSTEANILGF